MVSSWLTQRRAAMLRKPLGFLHMEKMMEIVNALSTALVLAATVESERILQLHFEQYQMLECAM